MFKKLKLYLAWRKWFKLECKPYKPNGNYAVHFYKTIALIPLVIVTLIILNIGRLFFYLYNKLRGKNETIGKIK